MCAVLVLFIFYTEGRRERNLDDKIPARSQSTRWSLPNSSVRAAQPWEATRVAELRSESRSVAFKARDLSKHSSAFISFQKQPLFFF